MYVTLPDPPLNPNRYESDRRSHSEKINARIVLAYTLNVGHAPRELYPVGTVGYEQWTYRPRGTKAERWERVCAITYHTERESDQLALDWITA